MKIVRGPIPNWVYVLCIAGVMIALAINPAGPAAVLVFPFIATLGLSAAVGVGLSLALVFACMLALLWSTVVVQSIILRRAGFNRDNIKAYPKMAGFFVMMILSANLMPFVWVGLMGAGLPLAWPAILGLACLTPLALPIALSLAAFGIGLAIAAVILVVGIVAKLIRCIVDAVDWARGRHQYAMLQDEPFLQDDPPSVNPVGAYRRPRQPTDEITDQQRWTNQWQDRIDFTLEDFRRFTLRKQRVACDAAIKHRHPDTKVMIKALLDGGYSVDTVDEGVMYKPTLLTCAAGAGNEAIVSYLIDECQANVDQKDGSGSFPLFEAARDAHTACVQKLLDAEADPKQMHSYSWRMVTALGYLQQEKIRSALQQKNNDAYQATVTLLKTATAKITVLDDEEPGEVRTASASVA